MKCLVPRVRFRAARRTAKGPEPPVEKNQSSHISPPGLTDRPDLGNAKLRVRHAPENAELGTERGVERHGWIHKRNGSVFNAC